MTLSMVGENVYVCLKLPRQKVTDRPDKVPFFGGKLRPGSDPLSSVVCSLVKRSRIALERTTPLN